MSEEIIRKKTRYYSIIEGTFRTQVAQDHPDAVRRDWVSADKSQSGTKFEKIVSALKGTIKDIQIHKGEYGENVNIYLDENTAGETPVISMGTGSREGEDFLKKVPDVDLFKEVIFRRIPSQAIRARRSVALR